MVQDVPPVCLSVCLYICLSLSVCDVLDYIVTNLRSALSLPLPYSPVSRWPYPVPVSLQYFSDSRVFRNLSTLLCRFSVPTSAPTSPRSQGVLEGTPKPFLPPRAQPLVSSWPPFAKSPFLWLLLPHPPQKISSSALSLQILLSEPWADSSALVLPST